MPYTYADKPKKLQDNAPGTKKKVLVAPSRLFTAIATPAAAGAGDGDTIEITGNHTFAAPDGFVELYTTLDTQELVAEMVGERDSRILNPKFDCFHPGIYKELLEFGNWAKDDEFIVLVQLLDGTYVQLGNEDVGCDITYKLGSGKNSGGGKGATFTVETFGTPYIYAGVVTLKP